MIRMSPFGSSGSQDLGAKALLSHGGEWTKKWALPLASGQAQGVVSNDTS